ncbi:hypothetical protein TVAG_103250 [Trichomonas vaginalis G3]|uniref:Uncharacterized protein n=1 Tax=Trichomonas vaginalis (strain ATCC PRA-98 / G3) TaxID=412133 RepID=A2EKN6_TRIV3|nr:hypothetical protein TVAGG3_0931390 [Trichomonas vaginalis G3]EAY06775.1 hypothetical protein TVAG_103250 [Trichomonas vaginalis G3]KAI5485864.1 hypothetical protein TVAGG3_0931390 [Trichomonas vaginalis G3]|eukprot:XP_001318998.1 hypothetical protein [Trichomonas vaginalis G3]
MFVLALTFCCSSFYRKFLHKDESSTWSTYFPSTTMPSITKGRNPNLSANVNSASEYYLSFCEFSFIKNNAVTVNGANIIMLISDSTFFNCSKLITSSSESHIYGCILSFNGTQSSKFQQVRVCASLCRFILENNSLSITNPDRSYTVSNISNSFYSDIFSYSKLQYGHFESITSEESACSELSTFYCCGDFHLGLGTSYMRTHNALFQENNITHCFSRYYADFYLRGYTDDSDISHARTKYNQLDNLYVGDLYVLFFQWTDATMENTNIHDCLDINGFFGTLFTSSAPLTFKHCSFINLTKGDFYTFKFTNFTCTIDFIDTYFEDSGVTKFSNPVTFSAPTCEYIAPHADEQKPQLPESNKKFERPIKGLMYLGLQCIV